MTFPIPIQAATGQDKQHAPARMAGPGAGLAAVLVALIRLWQWTVSAVSAPSCRFAPSCSHYGIEAIRGHGPLRGSGLTVRRLLRCHPWGGLGADPVPPANPGNQAKGGPQS